MIHCPIYSFLTQMSFPVPPAKKSSKAGCSMLCQTLFCFFYHVFIAGLLFVFFVETCSVFKPRASLRSFMLRYMSFSSGRGLVQFQSRFQSSFSPVVASFQSRFIPLSFNFNQVLIHSYSRLSPALVKVSNDIWQTMHVTHF